MLDVIIGRQNCQIRTHIHTEIHTHTRTPKRNRKGRGKWGGKERKERGGVQGRKKEKKKRTKRKRGGTKTGKREKRGGEEKRKREGDGFRGVEERGYRGGYDLILMTLDWHDFLPVFITCIRTNNANNATHYVKLGKKRRESSTGNYYIISTRVTIKAIIINKQTT